VGKEYAYYHGRDKWEDGHGDFHTSYEHTHEHAGPCISSRQVSAGPTGTRPLNTMCPPHPHPQAKECEVPAFCPQDGSLAQCPRREVLRFDVSGGRREGYLGTGGGGAGGGWRGGGQRRLHDGVTAESEAAV